MSCYQNLGGNPNVKMGKTPVKMSRSRAFIKVSNRLWGKQMNRVLESLMWVLCIFWLSFVCSKS